MRLALKLVSGIALSALLSVTLSTCGGNAEPEPDITDTTNLLEAVRNQVPPCAVGFEGWLEGFVVATDGAGYWFTAKVTRVEALKSSSAPNSEKLVGRYVRIFNAWGLFYETQKRWITDLSPGEHVRVQVRYVPRQGGMLLMRAQFRLRSPRDLGKLVFLGDSIMHFWGDLSTDFPSYRIYNSGVAGDNTWGVLERLDYSCLDLSPRAVVVMIGTNDLVFRPLDEIKIEEIIARLRAHRPTMPIILCRVMPRDPAAGVPDGKIRALNARIDALAQADPSTYLVDTYTPFLTTNGTWNAEYFIDGVHPNTDGYRLWAELLQPVLKRVLEPF
jgi:lysophospholipase L1-like esterase